MKVACNPPYIGTKRPTIPFCFLSELSPQAGYIGQRYNPFLVFLIVWKQ